MTGRPMPFSSSSIWPVGVVFLPWQNWEGMWGMQVTQDRSQPDTAITGPAGRARAKSIPRSTQTWPSLPCCKTLASSSVPQKVIYAPQQTLSSPLTLGFQSQIDFYRVVCLTNCQRQLIHARRSIRKPYPQQM